MKVVGKSVVLTYKEIINELNKDNKRIWTKSSTIYTLTSEIYVGDIITSKSYTVDYLKSKHY